MQVLGQIGGAWQNQRAELERNAHSLYQAINKILCERKPLETLQQGIVGNAVKALLQREDRSLGGWPARRNFRRNPFCSFCWIRLYAGMTARRSALSSELWKAWVGEGFTIRSAAAFIATVWTRNG